MSNSKYLGKIYEGRWKVIEMVYTKCGSINGYKLENIYNKETIFVNHNYMPLVDKNELTISKLRQRKVVRNKSRIWKF